MEPRTLDDFIEWIVVYHPDIAKKLYKLTFSDYTKYGDGIDQALDYFSGHYETWQDDKEKGLERPSWK